MLMPERLEAHLAQNHIAHRLVVHGPAHSAQVAASFMHIPGKEVAKSVALCASGRPLLAILPASYHINLEKLSAAVGDKVQLMEEQKCNELFPDCEPGAIAPFGELYNVPVYMDQTLAEDPEIVFSAGSACESVRLGNVDFVHLVKPQVCSFAEKNLDAFKHRSGHS